uniref:H0418A01.10 protein n=1 Tax=Oryza sativa TaxID=4530 RepID=Q01J58_ORYSA|nr:H0418A01.10 [Oryza sativa]
MRLAVATFLAIALSLSLLLAGALARPPPAPVRTDAGGGAAPAPQDKGGNLTDVLNVAGPFSTFLMYLRQTNLVAVFEHQAYRTHQGITIFVPVDMAFAAIEPLVLAGLSRNQLKHLLMYHSLAKHYTLAEFDGLSQSNPVKTLAGGRYAVNVTYDGGVVHVMSRWSSARVVGSVYESAAMAVYELDTVLLPDALFHAHPPVAATPPVPALPSPPPHADHPPPDDDDGDIDDYVPAPPPDPVAGKGGAKRSASGPAVVAHKAASYGAAAAMTLLVSCL